VLGPRALWISDVPFGSRRHFPGIPILGATSWMGVSSCFAHNTSLLQSQRLHKKQCWGASRQSHACCTAFAPWIAALSVIFYRLFYRALLQKRPIILRRLLAVATPKCAGEIRATCLLKQPKLIFSSRSSCHSFPNSWSPCHGLHWDMSLFVHSFLSPKPILSSYSSCHSFLNSWTAGCMSKHTTTHTQTHQSHNFIWLWFSLHVHYDFYMHTSVQTHNHTHTRQSHSFIRLQFPLYVHVYIHVWTHNHTHTHITVIFSYDSGFSFCRGIYLENTCAVSWCIDSERWQKLGVLIVMQMLWKRASKK